jgi:hypothetical protein
MNINSLSIRLGVLLASEILMLFEDILVSNKFTL